MCLRERKLIRVLVSISLLLSIMGKHKPNVYLKDCDAQSHIFFKHFLDVCSCQELIILPQHLGFPSVFLHVSACGSLRQCLFFILQFLHPPSQKSLPKATSFFPELVFTMVSQTLHFQHRARNSLGFIEQDSGYSILLKVQIWSVMHLWWGNIPQYFH